MNTEEYVRDIEDRKFWLAACTESLSTIWDNDEDDVYGELLEQ